MATLLRALVTTTLLLSAAILLPALAALGQEPATRASSTADRLETLASTMAQREAEIVALRAELRQTRDAERREELEEQLRMRQAEWQRQSDRFREIASGVDREDLDPAEAGTFEWSSELKELLGPLVGEVRRATGRPRRIHRLEREIEALAERAALANLAIANLDELEAQSGSDALRLQLEAIEEEWRAEAEQLRSDALMAETELSRLQTEKTSVSDTIGSLLQLFFRSRGRNLILALAVFVGIWLLFRLVHAGATRLVPLHRGRRSVAFRLVELLYLIGGGIIAGLAALFVLYVSGDWLLLSLASLFLFGIVWASKTALPRVWRQVMLLLNLGPVREGERMLYEGVPYRVERLGFHTFLLNPDLAGGRLRLPLGVIEGQVSRPAQEDEPWFPTRRGDWVLLEDGRHGRVTLQTPEIVTVVQLGGARRNFRSQDFFSAPPTVLSAGFRLWATFGVDYRHQALATAEIPQEFDRRIRAALEAEGHLKHLTRLAVEFKEAGASSLDIVALVDMAGAAAPDYQRLRRLVQRTCVDTCTEHGWVIPFTQVTMHLAAES